MRSSLARLRHQGRPQVRALQASGGGDALRRAAAAAEAALLARSGAFKADEREALRGALHGALLQNVAAGLRAAQERGPAAAAAGGGYGAPARAAERAAASCLVVLATASFPPAFKVPRASQQPSYCALRLQARVAPVARAAAGRVATQNM
jgi:hypothetical protein